MSAGLSPGSNVEHDENTTLVIGFCALVVFVLAGVIGSVLLCISLKRDSYLWDNSSAPNTTVMTEPNGEPTEQINTSNA
jgi:hypothetical protein